MAAHLTNVLLATSPSIYSSSSLGVTVLRGAPGIFLSSIRGHLNIAAAKMVGDAVLAMAARDKRYLLVFHDWSEMTDYDGEARVMLTGVARKVLPITDAIHLYALSPIVNFGVRAANVILKNVTAHPSAHSFEAALEAALAHPTRARTT